MRYYDKNTPCLSLQDILTSLYSTKISAHALAIISGKSSVEIPWVTELERVCNICSDDPYVLWRSM